MSSSDALRQLQIAFFGLPSDIEPENITQKAIPAWDLPGSRPAVRWPAGPFLFSFQPDQICRLLT